MADRNRNSAPRQQSSSFARLFCCGGGDDTGDAASIQPSAISIASANTVMDMTPSQKDSLFRYQADLSNAKPLGPLCFYVVGIASSRQESWQILESLKRSGILSQDAHDPTVYTQRITRSLTKSLPFLPRNGQRLLITMLFFWEEELSRWSQLEREADQIEAEMQELERGRGPGSSPDRIEHNHSARVEELSASRTRLRTHWGMAPSMRERKWSERRGSSVSSTPSRRQPSQTRT